MRHAVGFFALLLLSGCMVANVSLSLAPDGALAGNGGALEGMRYAPSGDGTLSLEGRDFSLHAGGSAAPDEASQLRGNLWLSIVNTSDQPILLHWASAKVKTAGGEFPLYFTSPDTRAMVGPPQRDSMVPPGSSQRWSIGAGPPGEPRSASGTGQFAHYEAWLPTLGHIFELPTSSRPADLEAAGRKAVGTRLQMRIPLTIRGERIEYVLPAVVTSFKTHRERGIF